MPFPDTAQGFVIHNQKEWQSFYKEEFKLKTFEDRDIDIAIDACGVCGTDVHMIKGGWGECPLPLCVGHEVVGRAVRVGKYVKTIKVGDRVGVGAQIQADLTCHQCKADQENYCPNQMDTYGMPYADGTISQGGYSSHIRAHEYFTFKIPDNIETAVAAPMLCAGLTVYAPLVRLGCAPGKKVAVIGLGGLGHLAVLFAVALGAEVYVMSHSPNKKEDALKMGAKGFIDTGEQGWADKYKFSFDFVLNTADATHEFNMTDYLGTLKVMGRFHIVGLNDFPLPELTIWAFTTNGCSLSASHIGNRHEMLAMLDVASKHNIKGWIEEIPISTHGCAEAVTRVAENRARYRCVLTKYDEAFGSRA